MSRGVSQVFLRAMRRKLDHGKSKGHRGWDHGFTDSPRVLLARLWEEAAELHAAVGNRENVLDEAADVANFAMFVAESCGALQEKGK